MSQDANDIFKLNTFKFNTSKVNISQAREV